MFFKSPQVLKECVIPWHIFLCLEILLLFSNIIVTLCSIISLHICLAVGIYAINEFFDIFIFKDLIKISYCRVLSRQKTNDKIKSFMFQGNSF